jgi:hypothetical protein
MAIALSLATMPLLMISLSLPYDVAEANIKWKLLSRQYSCEGTLKLSSDIGFVDVVKYDKDKAGKTYISDYIEEENITE